MSERSVLRQIRDFESGTSPVRKRRMALALFALIALGAILTVTAMPSSSALARDPLKQPFSPTSVWNLPIGSGAVYVDAKVQHTTAMASFVDTDVIVMRPTAPVQQVFVNYDDWGTGSRCAAQGGVAFSVPIPSDFLYLGNYMGNPDGTTTNAAAAILAADGQTIIQTQPFAHCGAGQPFTSHYSFANENIYGTGVSGSHGGSGLSAIGGTVRLGELVPGGRIPHALKLNMDSVNFYPGLNGYRWPAWKADSWPVNGLVPGYSGIVPESRQGSLLALLPTFQVAGLESGPGKIVAQAMMDYGGYIVDSAGWSANGFIVERSPDGSVRDEFQSRWGFALDVSVGANAWARDMDRIYTSLAVVNNWDQSTWTTVAASNGLLGAGLGTPRVAWAAPFGAAAPPPPPPPAPPAPIIRSMGADFAYSRSTLNLTFTMTAWNGTAPYRFMLSWGDGTMAGWSNRLTAWHVFSTAGTYRITMTAADMSANVVYLTKDVIAG